MLDVVAGERAFSDVAYISIKIFLSLVEKFFVSVTFKFGVLVFSLLALILYNFF